MLLLSCCLDAAKFGSKQHTEASAPGRDPRSLNTPVYMKAESEQRELKSEDG